VIFLLARNPSTLASSTTCWNPENSESVNEVVGSIEKDDQQNINKISMMGHCSTFFLADPSLA